MMYGASMRDCLESVKDVAAKVRHNPKEFVKMRREMMACVAKFWRDGSLEHPAFRDGRVEVCFSETHARSLLWFDAITGSAKQKRVAQFKDAAQAATMMIASASAYFSGLPFILQEGDDGETKKVADGGLVDNLPVFDANTITLKPFTDGFDVVHLTGRTPDIAPSEFVPLNYAVYPPGPVMLEHLFELGYRDAEAWLDDHLEERMQEVRAASSGTAEEDLPPVEFTCPDDGMDWYEKVVATLPMRVRDQVRQRPRRTPSKLDVHDDDASTAVPSLAPSSSSSATSVGEAAEHEESAGMRRVAGRVAQASLAESLPTVFEGWLELTSSALPMSQSDATPTAKARCWCTVDSVSLSWAVSPSSSGSKHRDEDTPNVVLLEASGKLPLAWVQNVSRSAGNQKQFSIDTADGAHLTCVADSADDVSLWLRGLRSGMGEFYCEVSRVSL
jgi:hypothetical protein